MKVRVCPHCGKHNLENAWQCIDCQETLSLKTLMDVESGQLLSTKPIANQIALSDISTHFEKDVLDILDSYIQNGEEIIWGCNITVVSRKPTFLFGYLIITSRQLIRVFFKSDLMRNKGNSSIQAILNPVAFTIKEFFGVYYQSSHPWMAVGLFSVPYPSQPLTQTEIDSRKVMVNKLEALDSVGFGSNQIGNALIDFMVASFKEIKKFTIVFYAAHDAAKAKKLLTNVLQSG